MLSHALRLLVCYRQLLLPEAEAPAHAEQGDRAVHDCNELALARREMQEQPHEDHLNDGFHMEINIHLLESRLRLAPEDRALPNTDPMTLAAKTSPQPLPANNYTNGTAIRKAYDTCRSLEESESWNIFAADLLKVYSEEIMRDMTPTVAGRVLGYGLLFAPSEDGRTALVRDINGCERDPELLGGLAHLYVFGLMRVCMFSWILYLYPFAVY